MPSKDCCALPVGSNLNHCGECHVTYATLTDFDRHQERDYGKRPPIRCKEPGTLGLLKASNDAWYTPEGLRALAQKRERASVMRQARAA